MAGGKAPAGIQCVLAEALAAGGLFGEALAAAETGLVRGDLSWQQRHELTCLVGR